MRSTHACLNIRPQHHWGSVPEGRSDQAQQLYHHRNKHLRTAATTFVHIIVIEAGVDGLKK